ncbi:MAG: crossover junction endodeoxyribonuclease RuvC [Thermoguttaceae bacterium]
MAINHQPSAISSCPLRILGIDPGLNITGYGVLEAANSRLRLCEAGVIRGKSRGSLTKRLVEIHDGVAEVIASLKPDVMAIEELYSHYARPRTAILMGHARGVICLAAAEAGIPVVHYAATQIKRILTGSGRAPKSQVQRAIQRELSLQVAPDPPDVADALAVALCHHYLKDKPRARAARTASRQSP